MEAFRNHSQNNKQSALKVLQVLLRSHKMSSYAIVYGHVPPLYLGAKDKCWNSMRIHNCDRVGFIESRKLQFFFFFFFLPLRIWQASAVKLQTVFLTVVILHYVSKQPIDRHTTLIVLTRTVVLAG